MVQSKADLSSLNGIGEVLAHHDGCKAWLGSEETYIYGIEPCINDGTKSGRAKELYKGGECVHVVSAVF